MGGLLIGDCFFSFFSGGNKVGVGRAERGNLGENWSLEGVLFFLYKKRGAHVLAECIPFSCFCSWYEFVYEQMVREKWTLDHISFFPGLFIYISSIPTYSTSIPSFLPIP